MFKFGSWEMRNKKYSEGSLQSILNKLTEWTKFLIHGVPTWCQVLYWAWANGGVDVKREFLGDISFVYLNWVIFHQSVPRQLTIRLFVKISGFSQAAHSFRLPKYETKSTYITVVKQPHLTSICTDTQVYKTLIHYEIEHSFIFWFVWPFCFPVISTHFH